MTALVSTAEAPARPPSTGIAAHAPSPDSAVVLQKVSKIYGSAGDRVLALDGVSLDVRRGEFLCLVGASGCGKTTLLNLISRLDQPSSGAITVNGTATVLSQEAALFPWLTAAGNIDIALRLQKVPKGERKRFVAEMLHLVRLDDFGGKLPHQLSGGMRQRVALARALAQRVDILLMDEPFGSPDAMTRDLLHDELERIWHETGITIVFVTHDVREAVRLGDRIVVLTSRPGRVAAEFPVEIERPRPVGGGHMSALAGEVKGRLRAEVRRHAND